MLIILSGISGYGNERAPPMRLHSLVLTSKLGRSGGYCYPCAESAGEYSPEGAGYKPFGHRQDHCRRYDGPAEEDGRCGCNSQYPGLSSGIGIRGVSSAVLGYQSAYIAVDRWPPCETHQPVYGEHEQRRACEVLKGPASSLYGSQATGWRGEHHHGRPKVLYQAVRSAPWEATVLLKEVLRWAAILPNVWIWTRAF